MKREKGNLFMHLEKKLLRDIILINWLAMKNIIIIHRLYLLEWRKKRDK
jgi:hypothetical protein